MNFGRHAPDHCCTLPVRPNEPTTWPKDMPLRETLSDYWATIQGELFPWADEEFGPLTDKHKQVITVLEMARVEGFVHSWRGLPGRPPADRRSLCRAFVAKAVLDLATTKMLIERLKVDKTLRHLCGWERRGQLPSEATFSRAFAEFAHSALPSEIHAALIERIHKDRLVGHIARDSTAIEAREKPVRVEEAKPPKRKRGRPKKGEEVDKPKRRLERQREMTLAEMLADLPQHCAVGTKRNAKGHKTSWIGYKFHVDVADGDLPVSSLLTSASLHDSQASTPLALITAGRVTNLYDLMDSAYDAPEIKATSHDLGHVAIIDPHHVPSRVARPRRPLKPNASVWSITIPPRPSASINAVPLSGSTVESRMNLAAVMYGCVVRPR